MLPEAYDAMAESPACMGMADTLQEFKSAAGLDSSLADVVPEQW